MLAVAMAEVGPFPDVRSWSRRFVVLADPNRLSLLLLIQHAGPIRVEELVRATGRSRDAVVQMLRLLRGYEAVVDRRRGPTARYEIADGALADLLGHIAVDDTAVMDALTAVVRIRSSDPETTDCDI